MRTRQKNQFGGHWLESIEPDVARFISQWPQRIILPRAAVADLVRFAVQPQITSIGANATDFATVFKQVPDFTLALMTFARQTILADDKRSKIRFWLLTNTTAKDSFGTERMQMELDAAAIAEAIGKTVSSADVRNADSQLRKRLHSKRAAYFVSAIQLNELTTASKKKLSALLPPVF